MDVFAIFDSLLSLSMEGPTPYIVLGVVVFFVFVEQLLVFSFFSPGSWAVILVSFLAFAGFLPVPLLIGSIFVGALAGTHLQYYLGNRHGERFLRFVNRFPRIVDLSQITKMRVSFWIVILSYHLPQIRGLVPFMAGASHMPKPWWYAASAIGVLTWLVCFIGMGMGAAWLSGGDFGQALQWLWEINTSSVLGAIFWVLTIGLAVYAGYKWRRAAATTESSENIEGLHHA